MDSPSNGTDMPFNIDIEGDCLQDNPADEHGDGDSCVPSHTAPQFLDLFQMLDNPPRDELSQEHVISHDCLLIGEVKLDHTNSSNEPVSKSVNMVELSDEEDLRQTPCLLNNQQEDNDDEFEFDLPCPTTSKQPVPTFPSTSSVPSDGRRHPPLRKQKRIEIDDGGSPLHTTVSDVTHVTVHVQQGQVARHIVTSANRLYSTSATVLTELSESDSSQCDHYQPGCKQVNIIPSSSFNSTSTEGAQSAASEWDQVQCVVPGAAIEQQHPIVAVTPLISYTDALEHLLQCDLNQYKGLIQTSVTRGACQRFAHHIFGPPKLKRVFWEDRDLYFCLAQCPFNNNDKIYLQMLQTIYKRLTGTYLDCMRFGHHWETIGFQGQDPQTDLRGCGMLGLLQLLYCTSSQEYLPIIRSIYILSLDAVQSFPLAVVGINMSRVVLQTLRSDHFNKLCNQRCNTTPHQFFHIMNEIYMAAFYHFYSIWKFQGKTIADSGFVLKEVEKCCTKQLQQMLDKLREAVEQRSTANGLDGTTNVTFSHMTEED